MPRGLRPRFVLEVPPGSVKMALMQFCGHRIDRLRPILYRSRWTRDAALSRRVKGRTQFHHHLRAAPGRTAQGTRSDASSTGRAARQLAASGDRLREWYPARANCHVTATCADPRHVHRSIDRHGTCTQGHRQAWAGFQAATAARTDPGPAQGRTTRHHARTGFGAGSASVGTYCKPHKQQGPLRCGPCASWELFNDRRPF